LEGASTYKYRWELFVRHSAYPLTYRMLIILIDKYAVRNALAMKNKITNAFLRRLNDRQFNRRVFPNAFPTWISTIFFQPYLYFKTPKFKFRKMLNSLF
jgi:hypothetical protein